MKSFRKAQGMPIATIAEGALVGKVDDLQFDLETGHIYGFRVNHGVFSRSGGVAAEAVERIGRDLVLVRAEADIVGGSSVRIPGEGRAWATEYRGTHVMTRRGEAVGAVEDLLFALDPARVVALLLDGGRVVVFDGNVSVGRSAVVLPDVATARTRPAGDPENAGEWRALFEPRAG